jgi:F-type H+-transporting ATPase subunit delta
MKVSKQNRREAKQLLLACMVNGVLDEGRVRQVVAHLVQTRPRGYMGILGHFERLVRLDIERRTAKVESAIPLSPDLRAQVLSGLAGMYGPNVHTTFVENLALLAGLRIKVGSDVYDGSVQARLGALQESF